MAKLEAAHAASHSESEEHTGELQEKLRRAQEAVKQLEIRRALDQEGWSSDVTLLRRQLSAVDRSVRLPDCVLWVPISFGAFESHHVHPKRFAYCCKQVGQAALYLWFATAVLRRL